jgi:N-acyl-D-amino-acid deacylase
LTNAESFDLLIVGADLIDGTGSQRRRIDVGVLNGFIAAMADLRGFACKEYVDATGYVLAPGFIDAHTHDDRLLLEPPEGAHPKLTQGITTVITGNCGISFAPLITSNPPPPLDLLGHNGWRFATFSDYLDALELSKPLLNVACLVGHATLRVKHMSRLDKVATDDEVAAMAADVELALKAGAIGLSTGLYYPPAKAADANEVIAVGASLRDAGGVVAMHIRDEGDGVIAALEEALSIGRQLGITTVLSHHKVVGSANQGRSVETLKMIGDASRYQSVCMDCYPYNASSTMLLPERIKQSREVLVTWSQSEPLVAGRSLFELAKERGQSPEDVARSLQPAGAIYFAMDEADVSRILAHPSTMIGSDGLAHDVRPHPRLWGTFPRVLGHYVREKQLFSLEAAIHKMSGLTAQQFGLKGRGQIKVGFHADLVIFDEAKVADLATFENPTLPSCGIHSVYVNGRLACKGGVTADRHAGQVLRLNQPFTFPPNGAIT